MAANPPGPCCTKGHLHSGTPTGELKVFGGVECYIKHPEDNSTSKVLYLLPEVLGHRFINVQLICDTFAHHGYLAIMPDILNNDPLTLHEASQPGFSFEPWKARHGISVTEPHVLSVLAAIHETYKPTFIGAIGYCFGAKYITRLLASPSSTGITAGFNAHPSWVEMAEVAGIKGPLSIAAAEHDEIFTVELRQASEATLRETGQAFEIKLYSGVEHGFASRSAEGDVWQDFQRRGAFEQALRWFEFFAGTEK